MTVYFTDGTEHSIDIRAFLEARSETEAFALPEGELAIRKVGIRYYVAIKKSNPVPVGKKSRLTISQVPLEAVSLKGQKNCDISNPVSDFSFK
ncbi:hypothetical protein ACFLZM_06840 [Thermodesulfobacteriota bacterium]